MAQPRQPERAKGAKSGLKDGEGAPPAQRGDKRPVAEEDTFGGAERTGNENVTSKNAKP